MTIENSEDRADLDCGAWVYSHVAGEDVFVNTPGPRPAHLSPSHTVPPDDEPGGMDTTAGFGLGSGGIL